jgi:hypothetical protein
VLLSIRDYVKLAAPEPAVLRTAQPDSMNWRDPRANRSHRRLWYLCGISGGLQNSEISGGLDA